MSKYVELQEYSAMDWHDWRKYSSMLQNKTGGFEIENPKQTIIDDIINRCAKEYSIENIDRRKIEAVIMDENHKKSVIFEKVTDTYDISIAIETDDFATDMYKVSFDYLYGSSHLYYGTITTDDPLYVPVYNFICAPKYSPSAQRLIAEAVDDPAKAKKIVETADMSIGTAPFFEVKTTILVADRNTVLSDSWYQDSVKLLQYQKTHPGVYEATYTPTPRHHLESIEKSILAA